MLESESLASSGVEEIECEVLTDNPTSGTFVATTTDIMTTQEIKNYIISEAKYYDIDPELALRIAKAESDFRNICCYKGCEFGQGIYQFEPITWEEQCEGEVDNIKNNIDCAIKLFSRDEYWRWNSSRSEWQ